MLSMHRCLCPDKFRRPLDPRKMSYKFAISCNSGNERKTLRKCVGALRSIFIYRIPPHLRRSPSVQYTELLPVRWSWSQLFWIYVFLEWCDHRFGWRTRRQTLLRAILLFAGIVRCPSVTPSIINQCNHFVDVLVTVFAAGHINYCQEWIFNYRTVGYSVHYICWTWCNRIFSILYTHWNRPGCMWAGNSIQCSVCMVRYLILCLGTRTDLRPICRRDRTFRIFSQTACEPNK